VEFEPPLSRGTLLRRYKRFLADVQTDAGEMLTMHCANTGAMSGCAEPGSDVWYSRSSRRNRKYPHTLELVRTHLGHLVGVNTNRANALVAEAMRNGRVAEIPGEIVRREVQIPDERGRFDFVVRADDGSNTFVEVKSVTMLRDGVGAFPDARSERATRHVRALERLCAAGERAVLIFCVQHTGIQCVTTADEIDPIYAVSLRAAYERGVVVAAYRTSINTQGMELGEPLPVNLS
jgi:sugar fermentation stimulation protein A